MAADQILMRAQPLTCREEMDRFIKSVKFQNPAAVSLTMKKRVGGQAADPIVASENFRHFRNRLNHTVLGSRAKRHGARLAMVVVLEISVLAIFERGEGVSIEGVPNWKADDTPFHIAEQFLQGVPGRRLQFFADALVAGWEALIIDPR